MTKDAFKKRDKFAGRCLAIIYPLNKGIFNGYPPHGLKRNLTSGEILSQVLLVNRDLGGGLKERQITNIVLMGSGEPLDNYDNVVKFLPTGRKRNIAFAYIKPISTCYQP